MISLTLAILPNADKGSIAVDEVVPTCIGQMKIFFHGNIHAIAKECNKIQICHQLGRFNSIDSRTHIKTYSSKLLVNQMKKKKNRKERKKTNTS